MALLRTRTSSPTLDAAGPSGPARRVYTLLFIAGERRGLRVVLMSPAEVTLGRAADADVVLPGDTIRPRHAVIWWEGDLPYLDDLGSPDGTYLNGERVRRAPLRDGDRLTIGPHAARVEVESAPARPEPRETAAVGARRAAGRPLAGALDEIPMPDVVQLLASFKATGTLSLVDGANAAEIVWREGALCCASAEGAPGPGAADAIVRLLAWPRGAFTFQPGDAPPRAGERSVSVDELFAEARRLLGALARPSAEAGVETAPAPNPLAGLDSAALDALRRALGVTTPVR
jgi:pSer/pThr/pTyr-binding forkhead associated (FHA) protein